MNQETREERSQRMDRAWDELVKTAEFGERVCYVLAAITIVHAALYFAIFLRKS